MKHLLAVTLALLLNAFTNPAGAQNSMVGDGFGGRLWYRPTNYTVGSYSAFSLCYSDPCDSSSNQLYGWGSDHNGELGNGPLPAPSNVPVPIPGMSDVRYFSTGYWMGAIKNDGTGWVWEKNNFPTPTQIISDVAFLDASAVHLSFVKNDGTVWSIGDNSKGPFGDGSINSNFVTPVQMNGVTDAVRVACGYSTSYVLLSDSSVLAVGDNEYYPFLGDPGYTDPMRTIVGPVPGLSGIIDIKAHSHAAAALDGNGVVYCWGNGQYTGQGSGANGAPPQEVVGLNNIVAISACADGFHFLALDANRNCYAWGLFNGDFQNQYLTSPQLVATDVIDIMAGETFSYIVRSDGSLWAAGSSQFPDASIWLNLPNTHVYPDSIAPVFLQLDPSLVPGACAILGTAAVPTTACDGSGGTITVSHFGGSKPYQYDIGGAQQASNIFTGLGAGNYTVTVTDADGCVTTTVCTVSLDAASPVVQLTIVDDMCPEDGFTLPSGTIVYTSGSYADTLFSNTGCDTISVISLTFPNYPEAFLNDTICNGGFYTLPSGLVVYAPGTYEDTLAVVGACDTIIHVYLEVGQTAPNAEVYAPDTLIVQGTSVALFASGGTSYLWIPSTGLSCGTCNLTTATPSDTIEYCVVVGNNNSCANDTACIKIYVEPLCTADNIYVPSAFSPNASGKNDTQCVYGSECIASMAFTIYDRWGNKVFESSDTKTCWDGIYNDKAMDAGVFVYHLSATLTNGETVKKQGNITLVR